MPIGNPWDDRCPDTRDRAQHTADAGTAHYQEKAGKRVPHACELAPGRRHAVLLAHRPAGDGHIRNLRQCEEPQRQRYQGDPLEQVQRAESPPFDGRVRLLADCCDDQAEAGRGETLERIAAAQHADQRQAEYTEGEELRRAEAQDERSQKRDAQGEKQRTEEPAQDRGRERRAKRSGSQPLFGHGMAVQDGRRRPDGPRDAEEYRRNGVRCRDHCLQPDQERKRGERIHVESEGQQQRQADDTAHILE